MQLDLSLSDGRSAHLRHSDAALTASFGADLVYTLDHGGRLVGAFREGYNLRRGLDGRVLARWRHDRGPRQRSWLDPGAAAALLAALRRDLEALAKLPLPSGMAEVVQAGLAFDEAADVAEYHRVYRPVAILPPDQYQALVLQATEGCSFNTCIFCALYREQRFRVKDSVEFALHIEDVRDFFGEGISFRRSLFLADANALIIPQERLVSLFSAIATAFALMPENLPPAKQRDWLQAHPDGVSGIYAFIDGLGAERKSVDDFHALRLRGLRRVYIGLESGHEPLLAWLRKPSPAAAMLDAVQRLKEAGLHVGVIVLTGIGGRRFHEGHCGDTAAVLNAMPLGPGDIIYFSPFESDPGAPYEALAAAEGIESSTPEFARIQEIAIRERLTLPPPFAGPKRVPYNLRDFVY